MKVLSLFDGMSCGMLAMIEAGQRIERYVAYEIDKYAIQTSKHNFPDIEQRGDVFNADFTEFEGFDWLIGGSPCTYWSIAQKNNRETEASGIGWELFSQYVRALHEAKPKYFIYENNKSMSKQIRASIDKAFGFEAVYINSALVSAQNRQRLYWVGKRNDDGTYSKVDVQQPKDRGILLKDILECGTADRDKAHCLKHQAGNMRDYFKKHHTQVAAEPVYIGAVPENNGTYLNGKQPSQQYRIYDTNAKGVAVTTCAITNVAEPVRVGSFPRPNGELSTSQGMRVYSADGKSVNLTAQGGGMGAKTGLYAVPVRIPEYGSEDKARPTKAVSCADGKVYTVYEVKDGKITIKGKTYPIKLVDGFYIIRKLTVLECMRLQTVPEWYEFPVSDSQAYKMLGNGWTVQVISHLIRACLGGNL